MSTGICVTVRKLMRPENTPLSQAEVVASDLHKLFWTEDEIMLDAKRIEGKCLVLPIAKVELKLGGGCCFRSAQAFQD